MGVFDVHNLIADIVGGFHQIDEGMTGVAQGFAGGTQAKDAQVVGDTLVVVGLGREKAELAVVACQRRGKRVLHDGGQHRVGEHEPAGTPPLELVGEQTEGVGVALEMGHVVPEGGAGTAAQRHAFALAEKGLNGFLAGVAEGRIAHVVGQAGCGHDGADLLKQGVAQLGMARAQGLGHVVAQRHAHAGHLQAVGEPVVHEDAAGKGEHLRLVLHTAERCGEDEPVVIALEFGAVVMPCDMTLLLS